MLIQERVANDVSPCLQQVDHQKCAPTFSDDLTTAGVEIPKEMLSRAVLDKQSNGTLRWMVFNQSGSPEFRTFKNEKCLDHYLSQNERVDIWEIEDRRAGQSKTLYKWCDLDEILTCNRQDELYRELASTTDQGVFCIHDLDTNGERYICQQKGWFHTGFEEVTLVQAQEMLHLREKTQEKCRQTTALGLAALATLTGLIGVGRMMTRGWQELKTTMGLSPSPLAQTLDKTTTFLLPALLTYGVYSQSRNPGSLLPAVLLAFLMERGFATAQDCPRLASWYDAPGLGIVLGVAVSGTTAYVADFTSGLQIIDVSNASNPVRLGWYDTSCVANDVAVSGTIVYVADYSAGGLQIIDVSNATNPVLLGWYDTPGDARGVAISGTTAYVADGSAGGLQIIDVSNASNPVRLGWYDTPGDAWGVAVSGTIVYVADDSAGGLQIIDVSNASNPVRLGWYDTPGSARGVATSGTTAYVADGPAGGFQIIDVSNAANPVRMAWYGTAGFPVGVTVTGTTAYLADGFAGLQIIDVGNATNPVRLGWYDTLGDASGVAVTDTTAYVADWSSLQIIDVACLFSSRTGSSATSDSASAQATLTSATSSLTNASSNPGLVWIGLGGVAGVVCLGATGATFFYLLKKRKHTAGLEAEREENSVGPEVATHLSSELAPIDEIGHRKIGGAYFQLSTLTRGEAEEIYAQTGHCILLPEGKNKHKYVLGRGNFGAIKIAKRIEDNQYVASKKVKGEEKIRESEQEASMQKAAAGENILPIYNTIRLEGALFHFMPLAGYGNGIFVQKQLAAINNPKLAIEILKFVAKDLLTGLTTIHQKGIYHLDIKPDNVVFTKDGTGYITDFGCAKKVEDKQIPWNSIGDNRYFSPERLQACKSKDTFDGKKTDSWAAGMMLLQMIKNLGPLQLFDLPKDFSHRVHICTSEFFLEKIDSCEELQKPDEKGIWWVIKGLLDPNPETRLSANEALQASCFKGLSDTTKQHVFEDLSTEKLIQRKRMKEEDPDLSSFEKRSKAIKADKDYVVIYKDVYDSKKQKKYYIETEYVVL